MSTVFSSPTGEARPHTPDLTSARAVRATAGFYDGDWDFAVRGILGKASRGGSDAGEVLSTIAAVKPKDRAGWFDAWVALGDRIAGAAAAGAKRGHRVSAARAYLRAANYYAVAVNAIDGLDGTQRLLPTFRAHRAAWDGFVANTRWPVARVDIPAHGPRAHRTTHVRLAGRTDPVAAVGPTRAAGPSKKSLGVTSITVMDYEHVVVTFTTDSKQLANVMAAEISGAEFSCCAHIEGPIRRVHRWHGRKHSTEQWRVEIEVAPDGSAALVDHITDHHGDEVHDLVVTGNVRHLVSEAVESP